MSSQLAKTKIIKTRNTYEASFYVLYGGKLVNVRKMMLNKHTAKKRGYIEQWTVTIENVPNWAIETWRTGNAYGNITDYVDVRSKLKKAIKRGLIKN
jgi:hypothetical protein